MMLEAEQVGVFEVVVVALEVEHLEVVERQARHGKQALAVEVDVWEQGVGEGVDLVRVRWEILLAEEVQIVVTEVHIIQIIELIGF